SPLSDMIKQLLLILSVRGGGFWRYCVSSIPNRIEPAQTAAQLFGNFRSRINRCLRAPPPPTHKLVKIFTIRTIPTNRQPLALRQSRQQTEISRAHSQTQLAFLLQPAS